MSDTVVTVSHNGGGGQVTVGNIGTDVSAALQSVIDGYGRNNGSVIVKLINDAPYLLGTTLDLDNDAGILHALKNQWWILTSDDPADPATLTPAPTFTDDYLVDIGVHRTAKPSNRWSVISPDLMAAFD